MNIDNYTLKCAYCKPIFICDNFISRFTRDELVRDDLTATKPYPGPCCYNNQMTRTSLRQEMFAKIGLLRTSNLAKISHTLIKFGLQYFASNFTIKRM